MIDFDFYKEMFDNELKRKDALDSAINFPVLLITVLIGTISYILEKINFTILVNSQYYILVILLSLFSILTVIAIMFLAKSYNNLFRGFKYLNPPKMSELRNYQKIEIPKYNEKSRKGKIDFEQELIDSFIRYTDNHFKINDKRSYNMYVSKSLIFCALIVTIILIGFHFLNIFYK